MPGGKLCRSRSSMRKRPGRTYHIHRGLAARRRYAAASQHQPEQGRGSSRPQERAPHRAPGRNPRPLQRGPALPHGRAKRARRNRHLLEYRPSRQSRQAGKHAGLTVDPELLSHISTLGGPTFCPPANTGGQDDNSNLNLRFCLLPELTRVGRLQAVPCYSGRSLFSDCSILTQTCSVPARHRVPWTSPDPQAL